MKKVKTICLLIFVTSSIILTAMGVFAQEPKVKHDHNSSVVATSSCSPGETIITPGQTVTDNVLDVVATHTDITEVSTTLSGQTLTVVFRLRDVPTVLTFDRTGIPEDYLEYEWSVSVDVDNNLETGYEGLDYELSATHFVFDPNSNVTAPIEDEVQVNTWERNEFGGGSYLDSATIIVDPQADTITLIGDIPEITPASRLIFDTFDYFDDRDEVLCMTGGSTGSSSISGMVQTQDSIPLQNILVTAYQQDVGNQWSYAGYANTDSTGDYTISDLPAGTHRVYFVDRNQNYRSEYYGDVTSFNSALDITVTTGATTSNIDATLDLLPPPLIDVDGGQTTVDPETGEVTVRVPDGISGTITITRTVTCTTGVPSNVMLHIDGKSFPMIDTGNNQYTVTLTLPDDLPSGNGPFDISISYECEGQIIIIGVGRIPIYDPSGLITDAETGQPVEGASVSLYRMPNAIPDKDGQTHDCRTVDTRPLSSGGVYGNWSSLPAASVDAGIWLNPELGIINGAQEISPTINPQITGNDGRYGWDVVEGCWYVVVETQGYWTIVSPLVGVPPEVTDLDIALSLSRLVYLPIVIK